MYPILAYFVSTMVLPADIADTSEACKAYVMFAKIAVCVVTLAGGRTPVNTLKDFLQQASIAWGFDVFTPKMHWLLHYIEEMAEHAHVLASSFQ